MYSNSYQPFRMRKSSQVAQPAVSPHLFPSQPRAVPIPAVAKQRKQPPPGAAESKQQRGSGKRALPTGAFPVESGPGTAGWLGWGVNISKQHDVLKQHRPSVPLTTPCLLAV